MRITLLSSVAWLGALQSLQPWRASLAAGDDIARLVGIASVLGTLTVLVYRLGLWRQQMENAKDTVGTEIKAHREESAVHFERLERRLDAIDHVLGMLGEQLTRTARRQSRAERRLDRLEEGERAESDV
jgi:hypothetical protein